MKRSFLCKLLSALMLLLLISLATAAPPKNVIFFIGDGMGFNQVETARQYAYGNAGQFNFQTWAYQGQVTTANASGGVTDSAAAGTALATGHKVNNGVISMATPGDGRDYQTLLEYSKGLGKHTGLVTTSYMTDATPAAFGAHEPSRSNTANISNDYFTGSRPNVLMGGGGNNLNPMPGNGYSVVTTAAAMNAVNTETTSYLTGQFGSGQMRYEFDGVSTQPHLREMTQTALGIMDNNPNGFFLMVEGGNIDHACHSNSLQRSVAEVIEFSRAVQTALDWAAGRTDTLILVTADHETGGLQITQPSTTPGIYPSVSWSTTGHSGANVPVYAWGVNADLIGGTMNNTDMFSVVTIPEPATLGILTLGGLALLRQRP